jgi:topoisomerase-4 subunit A
MLYRDGKAGTSFIKRFAVTGVTRDKEYDLSQGKPNSDVLYFSANSNGEAEIISVLLRNTGSIKKLKWDLDFADLQIKGRASRGNTVTKYPIRKVELKEKGVSTLKPRKIWFDDTIRRLNLEGRGELLGAFKGEDKLLIATQKGTLKAVAPELSLHFDENVIHLEKWIPKKPITAVYFDNEKERYFIKRFLIESIDKEDDFIKEGGRLIYIGFDWLPILEVHFEKPRGKEQPESMIVNADEFISVKGYKALGNQLTNKKVKSVSLKEALAYEMPEEENIHDIEVDVEEGMISESKKDDDSQITLDF